MDIADEIRAALRDVLLPDLRLLRADLQALRAEVALLRAATGPLRSVLLAGLQRLDARIESIERGVRRSAPCSRASSRCRPGRRRGP